MINVFNQTCDVMENYEKLFNKDWKGVLSKKKKKKDQYSLLTRTCPPGLASVGQDMSEVRVLVEFCTLWVQN